VDEDHLAGLHVGAVNEGLPGSQRHQRHRGLVQGERGWLGGDVVLVDRDVLRESPDPQVAGASVDLVAYLEVAYGRADPGHHARDVVAEHERGLVLQEPLELAVADHRVQRVDAGGAHLDQHVTVADRGLGYVGGAKSIVAVPLDDECLHDRSRVRDLASRSQGVEGRKRFGRGADGMRRRLGPRAGRDAGALIGTREPGLDLALLDPEAKGPLVHQPASPPFGSKPLGMSLRLTTRPTVARL